MNQDLMEFILDIICLKSGAYVINDEYANIGTHWTALYASNNDVIYFDSFGVEYIPTEI